MALIDQVLAVDAAAFVDPDSMPGAEALVYTKVGGTTRNIYGNVTRDPPGPIGDNGEILAPLMTIFVPNNTTNGISPTELNNGGDTITVSYPIGATAAVYPIIGGPISQDAGGCLWAVGNR